MIQKVLGVVPGGEQLHYLLQRRAGGLKDFDRELRLKVVDWELMVGHLAALGIDVVGTRFFEMGSGWFPTLPLPLCLYLGGAASVDTVDLNPHMKPDLTSRCATALAGSLATIAKATGRDEGELREMQRATARALERGASIGEATNGVIRYRAPADAAATDQPDSSLDVVFSNSVLEHIPAPVIDRCFAESSRILRPGGVFFHSANCGDHYAYVDRRLTQLHYLAYSDAAWKKWDNAFLYQNRLRATDFTRMARTAGFTIEVDTSRPHPKHIAALARIDVHPQFSRYSRDELAITSIDFIGRKPHASAPT